MKRIYFIYVIMLLSVLSFSQSTFSIGSVSSNYTLTCYSPVITMTANSGNIPYTYTWTVPGTTLYGNYANVMVPGNWTVTGQSVANATITSQNTFTVYQNNTTPTIAVSPTVSTLSCFSAASSYTGVSNLGPNVTTNWYVSTGLIKNYVGVFQGTINVFQPTQPGVYWFESINNLTGCAASKSVEVFASVGVPVFSVTSSSNYSIGCGSSSVTSIQITSVITSPILNTPVNYTILPPGSTVVITPTTTLGSNPTLTNITVPGTYVVYVKDITNNCLSSMSVSILGYTLYPEINYVQDINTLSCKQPSMNIFGVSSNVFTTISWITPGFQTVNSNSIVAVTNPTVPGSSAQIKSIGVYTLNVKDNFNQCVSSKTLTIMQDIRSPQFSMSPISNSVISCNNPSVLLVPIITPSLAIALVPGFTWYSPVNAVGFVGSQYTTFSPGSHTAIALSSTNGCTAQATYVVGSDNSIAAYGGQVGVSCPVTTAVITPTFVSSTSGLTFTWTGAPGTIVSSTNQSSITVNATGSYTCSITNTITNCSYSIECLAVCANGLNELFANEEIQVFPNPSNGEFEINFNHFVENTRIMIYDLTGKIVFEKTMISKSNLIQSDLSKGCYFYWLYTKGNPVKKGKLIVN